MKILVVSAMSSELKAVKEWIKSANLKESLDIDYLCCGIWNYETISLLEHYLTLNSGQTFIFNVWICGYWNKIWEKKSDPVQVASVVNLHTKKEMIVPPFLQVAPLKTCFSGENVVFEKSNICEEIWTIDDEMYFDMESRWIEFICSKYKIPRLILKVPFDFVWKNVQLYNWNNKVCIDKIFELLRKMPYCIYLQKILDWIKHQENI